MLDAEAVRAVEAEITLKDITSTTVQFPNIKPLGHTGLTLLLLLPTFI